MMQTYSPSGIVPLKAGIVTLLAGLAAAVLGGFAYGYAFHWTPIGFFRTLWLLIYCLTVGVTVASFGKRRKIRSPLFMLAAGLGCLVVGLWVYWGAYQWAKEGRGAGLAAWSPTELIAFGKRLFENGSFKLGGGLMKGWMLVGLWIVEIATMGVLILGISQGEVWTPFCEACQQWTTTEEGMIRLKADGKEPGWDLVLTGDLAMLASFPVADSQDSPHVRLDLATCPDCEHCNYLSLGTVTITRDKKGKAITKTDPLLSKGKLSAVQAEMIRQLDQVLEREEIANYTGGDDNDDDDPEDSDSDHSES